MNWYIYCENDPVMALDPSGLKLQVDKSDETFAKAVKGYLTKSTNYEFSVDNDGNYKISKEYNSRIISKDANGNKEYASLHYGSFLVQELIKSKTNIIIQNSNANDSYTMAKTNNTIIIKINLNKDFSKETNYVNDNGAIEKEKNPPIQIVLMHELIHAYQKKNGDSDNLKIAGSTQSMTQKGTYKFNGMNLQADTIELDTVGIPYESNGKEHTSGNGLSENMIRKEQGIGERITYGY